MAALDLLGATLREHRERAGPEIAGVPSTGRRRTRGLRREELAELAGVSSDHLKRVEQGRRHPSPGVLNALSRALHLPQTEYEHLCTLAGYAPAEGCVPRTLGPTAHRLLERLADTPVCICDATWTVVGWTPAWRALRCGEPVGELSDENVARRVFQDAPTRVRRTADQEAAFQRLLVAELRAASLRYPDDGELVSLVADLNRTSGDFRSLWTGSAEAPHRDVRMVLHDPALGPIELDADVVDIREGDLRAVVFTAVPGSAAAQRLTELARTSGQAHRYRPTEAALR